MIITDEQALRVQCVDVLPDEIGPIKDQLERELKRSIELGSSGIGLAAIQIGIPKNMAIVRLGNGYDVDLVNCKIEKAYHQTIFEQEGCLSFPNRFEKTMRFQEIYVVENAVPSHSFIATGLLAIVIQHETDHWKNVLLPDIAIKEKNIKNKQRPNDPCQCGKIDPITQKVLKYKKCCGR